MTKSMWWVVALVATAGGTWPRTAQARTLVTNASGCNNEFKGNTGAIKACKACVATGHYKQNIRTKAWACEAKSGGGDRSEPGNMGDMGPLNRGDGAPTAAPKTLSKYYSEYALIQPGTFTIGSAERESGHQANEFQAKVTLTRPFYMKTTEVTQGEWHTIMGEASKSYLKDCGPNCPVAEMSWEEALAYLNKISQREKLEPCYDLSGKLAVWTKGLDCTGFRLPTEAEWEYAARAGTTGPRYGDLDEISWTKDNAGDKDNPAARARPRPVGTKKPNAFGLFDMIGNMNEWVWDAYRYAAFHPEEGESRTDPIVGGLKQEPFNPYGQPVTGYRMYKGGSFGETSAWARAPMRFNTLADTGTWNLGFRPVRTKK